MKICRVLLCLMLAAPVAAQTPAEKGATLRGRVLLGAGRPARRATVRIVPARGGVPNTTTTDLNGRYEFKDVTPNEYRITAGKTGYIVLGYGQRRPFENGTIVAVRAGDTVENLDIALPAAGAISGRVTDGDGAPIEGVAIRLMQPVFAANRRQLRPVTGVNAYLTNDQGRYRIYGIPPGQYVVLASTTPSAQAPPAQIAPLLPPGYASTFFPGTVRASEAKRVTLDLSQDLSGIDLQLVRAPGARISGTIVDASGRPLRAGLILSQSQRSGGVTIEPLTASSNADGSFEIAEIPPGEWVLQAVARAGMNVNGGSEGEFASRFFNVDGTDISDIHIQTGLGSRVEGRIVFDGTGSPDPTSVVVTTLPSDFDLAPMMGPGARASVRADGTFVLEGLNGPRRFRLLSAPDSWMVKAVSANGRDVTDEPLPFGTAANSIANLEIILTNRGARVAGNVTGPRGQTVADYTVVVFATDSDRWYQGSRFLAFTRPKQDGTFAIANLPPGEYFVAAVDRLEGNEGLGEWQDPDVLRSLTSAALRASLSEGQTLSVTPRLILR